jgi:hypothetical protein
MADEKTKDSEVHDTRMHAHTHTHTLRSPHNISVS